MQRRDLETTRRWKHFPLLQTVHGRRIRRGTASRRWPRDEPLCFALRRTRCVFRRRRVCSFLNVCRALHRSTVGATNNVAAQRSLFLKHYEVPGSFLLFLGLRCRTSLCLLCLTDWPSVTAELWLPAHIHSAKFRGCLCLFLNPKSLWNDAKKYRCGISCRLRWQIFLDCWLFCRLTHSSYTRLKSFTYC